MLITSRFMHAVSIPSNLMLTLVRCLLVLMGLMVCLVFPAMAQPVKGSVYKDFLPMGSGASVALPEGAWEATQISSLDYPGTNWEAYTLKNQQAGAKVPFLVVRQTTTTGRWGNTGCMSQSGLDPVTQYRRYV